jgi:hypothetical protein
MSENKTKTNSKKKSLLVNKLFMFIFFGILIYFLVRSLTNTTNAVQDLKKVTITDTKFTSFYSKIDELESFYLEAPIYSNFQLDSMLLVKQQELPKLLESKSYQETLFKLLEIKNIQLALLKRKTI